MKAWFFSLFITTIAIFVAIRFYPNFQPSLQLSTTQVNNNHTTQMASSLSRSVAKVVFAHEVSEGVGVTVRRSIGTPALKNLSPFLMLDHFKIGKGAGFAEHPHRGQATITYMLDGQVEHEDFKGHRGIIGPQDVQWMQAGRGIVHSEMPVHGPGLPDPVGLQLWLDLPKAHKMDEPDYQEWACDEMPTATPSPDVVIKVIAGEAADGKGGVIKSPTKTHGGAWYADLKFANKGTKHFHALPEGWTTFAYILEGKIKFGGKDEIGQFNTVVLTSKPGEKGIELENVADGPSRFVLISGEPLEQPVVQYGPFVMTSREDIQQAFMDYSTGRNGFEGATDFVSESAKRLH